MYLFSQAYLKLLVGLYRSMPPGSRLTAGMLGTVVLLSAGYLFVRPGSSPEVNLMHGVPVAVGQLPLMEAAFAKANLKGYEFRGASIYVPRGQEADYMAARVAAGALPPPFGEAQHRALNGNTMFEIGPQHNERMRIAKQDELSQGISKMPGIESAYVLYDVDNKPGAFRDKVITATVMVKPAAAGQLDQELVKAIRGMVTYAIAGLKPDNVAVTDLTTGRTWYGDPDDAAPGDSLYNTAKRACEQDLKATILRSLGFIPNVIVEANVVLDRQRFTRIKQDQRSSARDRRGSRNATTGAGAKFDRSDRSGAAAQQPNTAAILGRLLGGACSEDDAAEPDGAEPVSRTQVEKESVGLTPTIAGVSVSVPISYFKKVWQERNPAEPGRPAKTPDSSALDRIRIEESAKIQRHVAQLLPSIESAAKATELVTVTTFQDIPIVEPPAPEFQQEVLAWARQSWRTLGTIGLALISLLVLRSMVRAPRSAAEVESAAAGSSFSPGVHAGDKPDGSANPSYDRAAVIPPPHARGFYKADSAHDTRPSPRDELSELVEDDPEAAANVLRNWIGQVK